MEEEELQVAEYNDHPSRRSGYWVGGGFVYSCDSENYVCTGMVARTSKLR
jgi:hypothetical protein